MKLQPKVQRKKVIFQDDTWNEWPPWALALRKACDGPSGWPFTPHPNPLLHFRFLSTALSCFYTVFFPWESFVVLCFPDTHPPPFSVCANLSRCSPDHPSSFSAPVPFGRLTQSGMARLHSTMHCTVCCRCLCLCLCQQTSRESSDKASFMPYHAGL